MRRMFVIGLVSISLAGCVTPTTTLTGAELYGQTVRVEGGGITTRTTFNRDGTAVTVQPNGQRVTARYWVESGQLCFAMPDGSQRECWAYTERLIRGRTIDATAPDGTPVRVTLE
jgi:hypothetical protein